MSFLDKLFNSKDKKQSEIQLLAPISGELVKIEDVPDVVFSEKIVGDGIAVRPTGNEIVAPAKGVISKIFEHNHAFSMITEDGVELFVHFGIDTIELNGEGFERLAQENQKVEAGTPIIAIDLPSLQEKAKSVLTPLVIANMDEISHLEKMSGEVVAGETVILTLKK